MGIGFRDAEWRWSTCGGRKRQREAAFCGIADLTPDIFTRRAYWDIHGNVTGHELHVPDTWVSLSHVSQECKARQNASVELKSYYSRKTVKSPKIPPNAQKCKKKRKRYAAKPREKYDERCTKKS